MDFLFPIKWVIELILVSFHTFFTFFGIAAESGLSWVLAIVGLVLVVRSALIPLFVKQIKSQRNMMLVQPELQKLQKQRNLLLLQNHLFQLPLLIYHNLMLILLLH